jgi:hypothetical protein
VFSLSVFEILGLIAGAVTSITVITVGIIKFTKFLIRIGKKVDLIDEIEKE